MKQLYEQLPQCEFGSVSQIWTHENVVCAFWTDVGASEPRTIVWLRITDSVQELNKM